MKYSRALVLAVFIIGSIVPAFASPGSCYAAPVVLPTGPDPSALVVGDLNGDGNDDFIVVYSDSRNTCQGGANVFVGNGDGTFQEKDLTTRAHPVYLTLGDFNRDGKQDVAIWNAGCSNGDRSAIEIKLGNGDGTFTSKAVYLTPSTVSAIAAADFSGDFKTDLFLVNGADSGNHKLLLGAGDGTFPRSNDVPAIPGFNFVAGITPADFNADGKLDLALFNADSSAIQLGNGDGTFRPNPFIFPGFLQAIGDLNGDSKLDVINFIANPPGFLLTVNLGNGDGTLQNGTFSFVREVGPVIVANVGLDGIADVVTAAGRIDIRKGTGDGLFGTAQFIDAGFPASHMMGADFNRDGLTDIVFTNAGPIGTSGATVLIDTQKCQ